MYNLFYFILFVGVGGWVDLCFPLKFLVCFQVELWICFLGLEWWFCSQSKLAHRGAFMHFLLFVVGVE